MTSIGLCRRLITAFLFFVTFLFATASTVAAPGAIRNALDATRLGLYDGAQFRLVDGACTDCETIPQALWYFKGEMLAVPKSGAAGFTREHTAQDDVREWAKSHPDGDGGRPPLVWIGSPQIVHAARLADGGRALIGSDGSRLEFSLTKKIASNRSYYDDSSRRYFADRRVKMRGRVEADRFVARTIWPEDYSLDFSRLPVQPLGAGETLVELVRAADGGARSPFAARVLWQRDSKAARDWTGKAVFAVMLNGAQGDDDEAHGGHFAIVTGVFGPGGEWGDWLVHNFYPLDSFSEKGIIASTLTMDSYMGDLNSGQSWYRPSAMLVAVLRQERAAALFDQAVGRVYNHFYRHDFSYRHATANCTGISMQTLRSLGWQIPEQGPTDRVKAAMALPYTAIREMSLESGRQDYDYLVTERTELFPFAAFDAAGRDLLQRIAGAGLLTTRYEKLLRDDIEAVIFFRMPQFPSSRAFGQAPVLSIDEYTGRVPKDKSQWKIVPVAPRPFPAQLRDAGAPGDPPRPSLYALYAYGAFAFFCAAAILFYRINRRGPGRAPAPE